MEQNMKLLQQGPFLLILFLGEERTSEGKARMEIKDEKKKKKRNRNEQEEKE